MTATGRPQAHALGLTSTKARSSAARSTGKRALKIEQAAKAVKAAEATAEAPRTYTAAQLTEAADRPALDVQSPRYDKLWAAARKQMAMEPSTWQH